MMASGQCIYCGKPVGVKVRPSEKAQHDAAMALAFAELDAGTAQRGGGGFSKWAIRLGALGLGALLVFAFMGPCMKT
jgi:hypothetical protein